MKTALVTGAAGFIGRHLVPKLEDAGYDVLQVDEGGHYNTFRRFSFDVWDNPFRWNNWTFDAVYHLAANISNIDDRMKNGLSALQDIQLDMAMFNYVSAHPPKQAFIYPSSCAIDNPEDPYAFVKIVGERCCKELHRQNIPVVILRPFSGYGADQSQEYPFPAILKRVMDKQDPVEIWGSGKQYRDWLHISDLVDAFIYAIDGFPHGVPIDIGTGVGTQMDLLAGKIINEVHGNLTPSHHLPAIQPLTDKPESSAMRIAKISAAGSYGWYSKTSLEEGIAMEVKKWRKLHS